MITSVIPDKSNPEIPENGEIYNQVLSITPENLFPLVGEYLKSRWVVDVPSMGEYCFRNFTPVLTQDKKNHKDYG